MVILEPLIIIIIVNFFIYEFKSFIGYRNVTIIGNLKVWTVETIDID